MSRTAYRIVLWATLFVAGTVCLCRGDWVKASLCFTTLNLHLALCGDDSKGEEP